MSEGNQHGEVTPGRRVGVMSKRGRSPEREERPAHVRRAPCEMAERAAEAGVITGER